MKSSADSDGVVRDAVYAIKNTDACIGEVYGAPGAEPQWRYRPPPSRWNFLNGLLRRPDFIFEDSDGREVLRIVRETGSFSSAFSILQDGERIGSLTREGLLPLHYSIEFDAGGRWSFDLPLFRIPYGGTERGGGRFVLRLESELVWFVKFDQGYDSVPLIAAVAFIHCERLRF